MSIFFIKVPKIKSERSKGKICRFLKKRASKMLCHLFEGVVEFTQDVFLIKDFPLVAVLIVVMDFLSEVGWEFVE